MASLRAAGHITDELQEVAGRLHQELTEGDIDFSTLTRLADELGEAADGLASTFSQLDQILSERILGADGQGGGEEQEGDEEQEAQESPQARGDDGPTREELLERARRADIPGRSSMSKEEIQAALEEDEQITKEELLEKARKLGIAGRSSMTKGQLRKAVEAEESVPKEDLLQRARDADIPGRSEMSKDELREALRTS